MEYDMKDWLKAKLDKVVEGILFGLFAALALKLMGIRVITVLLGVE